MVLFYDTFHRRPRMAAVHAALAHLRREPLSDSRIADHFNQCCCNAQHLWRERLLPPLVTLRLFVLQILHGNTAINHLRQLSGVDFAAASYCEARERLPLVALSSLLEQFVHWAQDLALPLKTIGQRVLIVDSSSFSMSDLQELRDHFGLPPSTKLGIGYPVAKLLALLDAATGMFISMLALPLFVHDMRHVVRLHSMLRCGDILLGDRAFCSFAHVALLNAGGVFACFRLHQRRKTTKTRGVERWHRDRKPPVWMTEQQWFSLPKWIEVRIVRYAITAKGYRTRHIALATTLLDEHAWPDQKLAELYGRRWEIETCFDHLKTTMGMNVLKCRSIEGVQKELAVYLLVYNLVRLQMLRHAQQHKVSVSRVSFVDALRWVCCRMLGLSGVDDLLINPRRPGRREPRVIRRRMKEYNLMKRTREALKTSETFGESR
jgi:hypothetical protein